VVYTEALSMDAEDRAFAEELRRAHIRRLRQLKLTVATKGSNSEPEDKTEIEDIEKQIKELDAQLGGKEDRTSGDDLRAKINAIETEDISAKELITWYSKLKNSAKREEQFERMYRGRYVRWKMPIESIYILLGDVLFHGPLVIAGAKIEHVIHHPYETHTIRAGTQIVVVGKIVRVMKSGQVDPEHEGCVFLKDCYIIEVGHPDDFG
jgi:hypothetical protein